MRKLDDVSTRELLATIKRRAAPTGPTPDPLLAADVDNLVEVTPAEVLDYPYAEVKR